MSAWFTSSVSIVSVAVLGSYTNYGEGNAFPSWSVTVKTNAGHVDVVSVELVSDYSNVSIFGESKT